MTGLVLEGGGHRGIYTAGVLDVFIENKIKVDGVIGVSAGAIHGASFVAGQVGRSVRYTEKSCNNKDYMSFYPDKIVFINDENDVNITLD